MRSKNSSWSGRSSEDYGRTDTESGFNEGYREEPEASQDDINTPGKPGFKYRLGFKYYGASKYRSGSKYDAGFEDNGSLWYGAGFEHDVSSENDLSNGNSLDLNAGAGTTGIRTKAESSTSTNVDTSTRGTRSRTREKRSARESALSLLEYRDRTEQELRQKLLEREYSKDEIEETVRFLKEYRYLDDEAYAMRFIRSQSGKKSARQIRATLERKGVNREIIASCLEEEPVDEASQVRAFLEKKGYRAGENLEADVYRKLTASLARRGFSWDVIRRTMEEMKADFDEK